MSIKENIAKIKKEIPNSINILAATKGKNISEIKEAIKAGIKIIGENYVQEAEEKIKELKVEKHFIGHLQTNKVKKAVYLFDFIETVDSKKIALEINKECKKIRKVMPVLIEVNIEKEENKHGCFPEEVEELAGRISHFPSLKLKGLMTMAPFFEDTEKIRPFFKKTKQLFDKLKEKYNLDTLSMGMSDSYKIAIEEGATMIRVGTKIFEQSL